MTTTKEIATLRDLRGEQELAHLLKTAQVHELTQGNYVYALEGKGEPMVYAIQEGSVALEMPSSNNKHKGPTYLHLRVRNDVLGYEALNGEQRRNQAYCLTKKVVVKAWPVSTIAMEVARSPEFGAALFMAQSQHQTETEIRAQISKLKKPQQLAAVLGIIASKVGYDHEDKIAIPADIFTHETLGSFVWTRREIITMYMNRFRRAKWVTYDRHHIVISGGDELVEFSMGERDLPAQ